MDTPTVSFELSLVNFGFPFFDFQLLEFGGQSLPHFGGYTVWSRGRLHSCESSLDPNVPWWCLWFEEVEDGPTSPWLSERSIRLIGPIILYASFRFIR